MEIRARPLITKRINKAIYGGDSKPKTYVAYLRNISRDSGELLGPQICTHHNCNGQHMHTVHWCRYACPAWWQRARLIVAGSVRRIQQGFGSFVLYCIRFTRNVPLVARVPAFYILARQYLRSLARVYVLMDPCTVS